MNLKSFFVLTICMFLVFLNSCTNDEQDISLQNGKSIILSPEEYASIAYDSVGIINAQEAVEIVQNFYSLNYTRSTVSPSVIKKQNYKGTVCVHGKLKNLVLPMYELSLGNDGGYAIVSADSRIPEILAYSKNGKLSEVPWNDVESMLEMSMHVALTQIANYELLQDSLRQKTLKKIADQLGESSVDFNHVKNLISVKHMDEVTRSSVQNPDASKAWKVVKPMIATKWDQCYPYNKQLGKAAHPIFNDNKGFNAVGCAGVATAQMVAFYQTISTANGCILNWNKILSDPIIDEESDDDVIEQVSQLMKCVADGIQTEWDPNGDAGNSDIKKIYNYLNTINLTFDAGKNYKGYTMNAARIVSSLDQGYPVFITGTDTYSGGGHIWILDGYEMIRRNSSARTQIMSNNTYIHANFGWSGISDGYYLVDIGTTNLTFQNVNDYSSDLKLYPNVRKK